MDFLAFIIIGILILWLVSGTYLFVVACVRRKELPWLVEAEIKKTRYGKYYDSIVNANQWLLEHNAEDVYVQSEDGLRLHAYWVSAENAKGTILFAHGYRSVLLLDFGMAFDYYHKLGMNLLIPDQRSHGKSQGRYITFGVKEHRDMQCWIDFHNQKHFRMPIILSGLSMGASTMLYLADKELPNNVKGIIADCGFNSPKDIIETVFRKVTRLPAAPSLWVAEFWARLIAGFSFYECDTKKTLKNSRLPVLLVHGEEDDFVPCEMTKRAYEACTSPKKILLVEGASHGTSFLKARERYTSLIIEFLQSCIENF